MTARVTISRSGHLFVIKKGGIEVTYSDTKIGAQRKAKALRESLK